jgi:uncharacterized protein YlxW (UPF0749 family)
LDKKKISIILGIVCMILTFTISIQFKTISAASSTITRTITENKLRDEVFKWKEKYERVYESLEEAEKTLEAIRKKTTENDGSSAAIEEELKLANRLLGFTELTGKGAIITLDDNKNVSSETAGSESLSDYVVHDGDLIEIINELKNAGVDAISVNEQRIVNTTGIVCDGSVVRINREKVGAPYVIKAIGSPERIVGVLSMPGGYMEKLRIAGVVTDVKKSNSVTVPKYNGVISNDYIRNVK